MNKLLSYDNAFNAYRNAVVMTNNNQALDISNKALILAENKLRKVHSLCFKQKNPVEIDLDLEKFNKLNYNKRYIISLDNFYLNIWRKTGNGAFGLPIQFDKHDFTKGSILSNYYLISLDEFEVGKFYDVEGNEAFELLIDSSFKCQKQTLSKMIESTNRLFNEGAKEYHDRLKLHEQA